MSTEYKKVKILLEEYLTDYSDFINNSEDKKTQFTRLILLYLKFSEENFLEFDYIFSLDLILNEEYDIYYSEELEELAKAIIIIKNAATANENDSEIEADHDDDYSYTNLNNNESGYVYILINSSMDGLVKIGMTTRDPQDRVEELSRATGVPTPFQLIYKEYFSNCLKAEKAIHSLMEHKGYRVSSNREFFNIPVYEVIPLIQEVKRNLDNGVKPSFQTINSSGIKQSNNINELIEELIEEADDYRLGFGDKLEDINKTIELLNKAVKMGSSKACFILAKLYLEDLEIKINLKKALELLNEGIKIKDKYGFECYKLLASIYSGRYENEDESFTNINNAFKCWDIYFNNAINFPFEIESTINFSIMEYLELCVKTNRSMKMYSIFNWFKYEVSIQLNEYIDCEKDNIKDSSISDHQYDSFHLEYAKKQLDKYLKIKEFVDYNLTNNIEEEFKAILLSIEAYEKESTKITIQIEKGQILEGDVIFISDWGGTKSSTVLHILGENELIINGQYENFEQFDYPSDTIGISSSGNVNLV